MFHTKSSITMSFVDLATMTLHRRFEMEGRISSFAGKCDLASNNIRKLKVQARTFVDQLNCDPSELKERFLSCMKRLDEYIYLITEFNLCIENLEKTDSMELAPVQDLSYKNYPVLTPTNLMDVLSERAPTAPAACANMCPERAPRPRPRPRPHPRPDHVLIAFSSTSCSAESVPEDVLEKQVQCVAEEIDDLTITDPKALVTLPKQPTLDTEQTYEATVMYVDGPTFWLVERTDEMTKLFQDMTEYYSQEKNRVSVKLEELSNFTCCAYYDAGETHGYWRAMLVHTAEGSGESKVFLVDTGEIRALSAGCLQPLAPRFAAAPPYAHCAHLADVEFLATKTDEMAEFLKQFLGTPYTMKIEDNSSESLGVYLFLDEESTLNELVVQEGLATHLDKPRSGPAHGPPELRARGSDGELDSGPEHDNPVEAVTGYNNRDEMDICKHYKGGSEKTCFKGAKCTKRHVMKHPDGWTLDRVSTPKCRAPPLPAPGAWRRVLVTYVCHFDRLYVHFQHQVPEELPSFGVVLPPDSLPALVRDLNSSATYAAFRPLQVAPAPGELVAAKYRDGLWYRARVLCATRADQSVEVMYIDYGNVMSVKENEIMELEHRFTVLPAQAVLCRLAGVAAVSKCSKTWAEAKRQLAQLAQERTMEVHIISRDYDELTVEMLDLEGFNLAEQLAAGGAVSYTHDYEVEDDSRCRFKLVQA